MDGQSTLSESNSAQDPERLIARAQAYAKPLLDALAHDDGENALVHAEGVAGILRHAHAPPSLQAAAYLAPCLAVAEDAVHDIANQFGPAMASLVDGSRQLARLERAARAAVPGGAATTLVGAKHSRSERVRRMLLAFSRDLRGVLLHLASRLQSMRWHVAQGRDYPEAAAQEALDLLAPMANRLGVWALKWELEDLAFRFTQPEAYADMARLVDHTRERRELDLARVRQTVVEGLAQAGVPAEVLGRAKHLYSIWRKMQGKRLHFQNVYDLRALRVIVPDVGACYAVLAWLHERFRPVEGEYDDYIARPKANGYQSLHTVVSDDEGLPMEVQIRTQAMHDHAENGVAAHWAYKEAGARGYGGAAAAEGDAHRVSQARKAMLHQLLAWEREVTEGEAPAAGDERVYVFTPQGAVVDLPVGATAIDFAYTVHTTLGHRCRGAKLDGALVPLSTPLKNGVTVEVTVAKEGGPSLDWLNPDLGYLASPRSRAKVRAWFNAQAHEQTVARGRDRLEKLLQRSGRTATKHADLADRLALVDVETLYAKLGKDELPLHDVEKLWEAPVELAPSDDALWVHPHRGKEGKESKGAKEKPSGQGDVLVVGVDSLLTGLAKCCRPAPPDAIGGFVTRHKGVAIHRAACTNFLHMAIQAPQRVCAVAWGADARNPTASRYAVDVSIEAADRPGLLRDISEVFAKERMNVTAVQSQTVRGARDRVAWMTITVEVADAAAIRQVLPQLARVPGVRHAARR